MTTAAATNQRTLSARTVGPGESAEWDDFVSAHRAGHLLQSWAWGEFKSEYGWRPYRVAVTDSDGYVAAAQVLIRSVSGLSLAYVPRGPVASADDPEAYKTLLKAVHRLAKQRHAFFLKIEPNETTPYSGPLLSLLRRRGFIRSTHTVQARATLMLDLEDGREAVLAQMKGKTRYNIRLAERRGVTVRSAATPEDLERFHELMALTGERDGFPTRSLAYYRDVLEVFRRRDQAELLLAEFDGKIVAGIMVFGYGPEGLYMYGASSNEHRREMPTYLLQWRAIEWCLDHGCTRYDLWGIPEQAADGADERDELAEKNVRAGLWGVYRFKQGFGGEPLRYVGAYDRPYVRPLYLLWSRLRKSKEL